ncbi:type II secretion system F family protein [Mycobacterium sp. ACS4331]|uniref:type II secretion system F family protein n=1 Tax=Mycobacterium sp. ACS4331 TaxID=1834121 RepID=UPI0007FE54F0|nr:type II secretion system F family protein [Mycobacterium sp. ACS4331]OBF23309.1 pilus assembly protein TadC [Mycobacterium sp. ACS4331]
MIIAALALAVALILSGRDARIPKVQRQSGRVVRRAEDPLAVAASLDVFAVCLTSGLAVAAAARATAPSAPPALAGLLRRAADLLAVGADPATAWAPRPGESLDESSTALLRLARRSSSSGGALAAGVAELAEQSRQETGHRAEAAAQRASVVIAGPLGLCFLPAFVCLGIVPVVAGLAGDVLGSGLM